MLCSTTPDRSRVSSMLRLGEPIAMAFGAIVTGAAIVVGPDARIFIMVAVLLLAAVQRWADANVLLVALVLWLALLGTVRRMVSFVAGSGSMDPLLLVGPAVLGILALAAVQSGALRPRTPLSTAVLALSGMTLVSALNPMQGSLEAGIAGLLFVFVPQLGFWIGRELPDAVLRRVLRIVIVLALAGAAYGLLQTTMGLPSWDAEWVRESGYEALNVGGVVRPFSAFTAASEYAYYLGVGLVLGLVLGIRGIPRWAIVVILIPAMLTASVRSVVVQTLIALLVTFAARRGLSAFAAITVAVIGLIMLPWLAGLVAPTAYGDGTTSALVEHQLEGLGDPLDPSTSTLAKHFELTVGGIRSAIDHPLGVGIGSVSIAASRFGGVERNTERDVSNAAVALGLPGLLAYSALFGIGYATAYRLAARDGKVALAALAVLTVTALQWLNGGQYAVAALPWLCLGWIDRRANLAQLSASSHDHSVGAEA